jgi:hypothetical protein
MTKLGEERFVTDWITAGDNTLVFLSYENKKIVDPEIRFQGVTQTKTRSLSTMPEGNDKYVDLGITTVLYTSYGDFLDEPSYSKGINKYSVRISVNGESEATFPQTINVTLKAYDDTVLGTTTVTVQGAAYSGVETIDITDPTLIGKLNTDKYVKWTLETSSYPYSFGITLYTSFYYDAYTNDPKIIVNGYPTGYTGDITGITGWKSINGYGDDENVSGTIDIDTSYASSNVQYQIQGTLK